MTKTNEEKEKIIKLLWTKENAERWGEYSKLLNDAFGLWEAIQKDKLKALREDIEKDVLLSRTESKRALSKINKYFGKAEDKQPVGKKFSKLAKDFNIDFGKEEITCDKCNQEMELNKAHICREEKQ